MQKECHAPRDNHHPAKITLDFFNPLKEKIMGDNGRAANKPTIVLIHGLWLTPRSWEGWIDRYRKAGYNVLAPSWPGLEG
ncbi:MAG TPA: alpha/beta hydrolase, partial [Gemmatimonadaceae bacterium]